MLTIENTSSDDYVAGIYDVVMVIIAFPVGGVCLVPGGLCCVSGLYFFGKLCCVGGLHFFGGLYCVGGFFSIVCQQF